MDYDELFIDASNRRDERQVQAVERIINDARTSGNMAKMFRAARQTDQLYGTALAKLCRSVITAGCKELFDDSGKVITDKLTPQQLLGCEALYEMIYSFDSSVQMTDHIIALRQAAKQFRLTHDFDAKMSEYKKTALGSSKCSKPEPCMIKDTSGYPYIIANARKDGQVTYKVSCPLLAEHIRSNYRYIITHDRFSDNDRIFWYDSGVYKPITDSVLQGYIKKYITDFDRSILRMRDVKEVMQDLKTDMQFVGEEQLNADEDMINFENGLYSISQRKLLPHSPDVLSTIQLPCRYEPNTAACPNFVGYLTELSGDEQKAELLLEYMAACISNIAGYRLKKALFMYGDGDTGKSQAKALTEKMLGADNCSAGDLSDLESRFGTSSLYQKRLYGSGDMSFVSVTELKIFKNITGGDDVFLEFKGRNAIRYKYKGLLWFCANALPSFSGDRGDWVYNRMLPFECKSVIPVCRQDKHLLDKMFAERTSIISDMLIPALHRLIDNNYELPLPNSILQSLEAYKDRNSPVRTFCKECCEMRKDYSDNITVTKLFEAFKKWYTDNMGRVCGYSRNKFKTEVLDSLKASGATPIAVHKNSGTYLPVTLKNSAAAYLL